MQNPTLFKLVLSTLLIATSPFTLAQDVSKRERAKVETIGVIGGLAIGGLAGGPPGAIVTAAFGTWVSEKVIAGKENRLLKQHMATTVSELQSLQEEHTRLQLDLASVQGQLDQRQLLASNTPLGTSSCCVSSNLVLHFRSNSDQVEALYDDAMQQFVNSVSAVPNAVIEINGHADRRGPDAQNLSLSQRRVRAVETRLRAMGLRNVTYQTVASGEHTPLSSQDSLETNFFDRGVELRLVDSGSPRMSMK